MRVKREKRNDSQTIINYQTAKKGIVKSSIIDKI